MWFLVRFISKCIFEYSFWLSFFVSWKSFGFLDRLIKWFRHSNTWGPPSLRPPFSLKAAAICLVTIFNMHYKNMFCMKETCFLKRDVCCEKQFLLWDVMLHISHWNMILRDNISCDLILMEVYLLGIYICSLGYNIKL